MLCVMHAAQSWVTDSKQMSCSTNIQKFMFCTNTFMRPGWWLWCNYVRFYTWVIFLLVLKVSHALDHSVYESVWYISSSLYLILFSDKLFTPQRRRQVSSQRGVFRIQNLVICGCEGPAEHAYLRLIYESCRILLRLIRIHGNTNASIYSSKLQIAATVPDLY